MRALEANAVFIGENAAFEEHWKKTGYRFVQAHTEEDWPTHFALFVWLDTGAPDMDKLNRQLVYGQTLWVPESQKNKFVPFKGDISYFPDRWLRDIDEADPSCYKLFPIGGRFAKEEVCREPRRAIRAEMGFRAHQLYQNKSLAAARLSFYPDSFKTLFSFRVDADEFEPDAFEVFFQTAKKYSHAISVFFSMANYENQLDQIRRCVQAGFDVHSHAYTHYTYRSYAQNRFNLQKADALLRVAGSVGRGFVSPYGRWNGNLQKAMDESGYEFSSEFSYNYDDLPSYPVVRGVRSRVLQVPVHPVGLGVYMEAGGGYDEDAVQAYYKELFYQRYEAGEPIIFYDHPTKWLGVYPGFMDFLFGMASQHKDIWQCSMTDWARRWKALDVEAHYTDQPARHPTVKPAGWEEGRILVETNPIRRAKQAVKKWLDWEPSTPTRDIVRESLPSYIKFVMRSARKLF